MPALPKPLSDKTISRKLSGCPPNDLSQWKNNGSSQTPMITFGPGIRSAVAKGDMDKDELFAGLDELGIKYSRE